MEDNEKKLPNANENDLKKENVFTKEVTPIKPGIYFLIGVGNTLKKLGLWIVDLLWSILCSIGHFLELIGVGIVKAIFGIYKFIKYKVHQFKYNDLFGRLSFIWLGASNFKHKQYVNGVIYTVIEIGFILFMALGGGYNIAMLGSLGSIDGIPIDPKTNSIVYLILGILSLLVVLAFVYIWLRNIQAAYDNYRIDNFVKYNELFKAHHEYTDKVDAMAQEAFNNKINRFNFKKQHKAEFEEYLATIDNPDPKYKDFVRYLINETISNTYEYCHKLKRRGIVVGFYSKSLDKYTLARANGLNALKGKNDQELATASEENKADLAEKAQIRIEKYENATLSGTTNRKQRLQKQLNLQKELVKTHASFGTIQDTKNNDKYGKFNRYYSDLAEMEGELNFYKHYNEFVDKYNGSLTGYITKNTENATRIVELKNETQEKIAKTKAKFKTIRDKKAELEAKLTAIKANYVAQVKEAATKGIPESELVDAKAELVEQTTRLMGQMHDLPSDKSIKSMEREEINESKHAFLRDKKYLKTNFTSESFAREEVINLMILEYRIPYEDAVYYADLLFIKDKTVKIKRLLTQEEVDNHINELTEKIETYTASYPKKYNGRAESFKEQAKSLLNDKFHITILALPFLGILIFTVMPLIFSLLIAFTNFDHINNEFFTWVGLQNFISILNPEPNSELATLSSSLMLTFSWTMIWAVFATFSNYFLGIIVALMINKDGIKFKALWRTIFVMTIAIPAFVSLLTISQMLKEGGIFEEAFGIKFGEPYDDSQGAILTKTIIILVNIWVGIPYTMLSTTGILLNIPKDLYESSRVDGAGTVTQFFKITMPYILFVTGPYLITSFVGNINNFNVIYFLSGGGPLFNNEAGSSLGLGQTDLMITFIYKIVNKRGYENYGLASTIGIFVFVICAFFSLIMYNKSGSIQQEDQFQ